MAEYRLDPVPVPPVQSRYRTIRTALPVPESLPILEALRHAEPRSMSGQPPIVWHSAEGCVVADQWGNRWLDWSSGVLITNSGHGCPEIKTALLQAIEQGLLATYVFPHAWRAELSTMLQALAPDPARYRVFLLSTGSEATENCIKLAKTYALAKYGERRKYVVSFERAFHGRTMGAQLAGGSEGQKAWMVERDATFIQVPFPDGFRTTETSFDTFTATLQARGIAPDEVAGVMVESYQGGGADFMPTAYARALEQFCRTHDIVLICDEVQSGFARTGKMFAYEHYGITPDLIACGKGISSSLPLAAVLGREDILDLYPPGSMTSTHSGSPLPVVAAIANLHVIKEQQLVKRAAELGEILHAHLARLVAAYPDHLAALHGKGMVAGIHVVKPGTKEPDAETALQINLACFHRGLLMFAPVGFGGATVKIAPPLTMPEDALLESLQVFAEAVDSVLAGARAQAPVAE